MLPSRVFYSAVFFLLIVSIVLVSRPETVVRPDGRLKPFGLGRDETVMTLGVIVVVSAFASMYLFSVLESSK